MYNHRIISFVAGTAVFWFAEMLSMAAAWLLVAHWLGSGGRENGKRGPGARDAGDLYRGDSDSSGPYDVKQEDAYDEEKDIKVKDEWEEGPAQETLQGLSRPLLHSGDADDEEEGEDAWTESRPGASGFHDGKGGSLRRRSSREVREQRAGLQ